MVLRGIILADGWENRPFDATKLSCYKERENVEMAGTKRQAPAYEELRQAFMAADYKIERVRKQYKVNWLDCRRWLKDYGLIDIDNHPTDKARQEPVKYEDILDSVDAGKPVKPMGVVEPESHTYHINQFAPIGVEVPQYEPKDNGWQFKDDKPTPYKVVDPFDANKFKLDLIASTIEVAELRHAPADMTINLISGIIGS